jgi:penicillin-binding protein 1C
MLIYPYRNADTKYIFLFRATIIALLVIAAFSVFPDTAAHALPTYDEVKASYKKSDAVLLDRHGAVIHDIRVDSKGRRLDWTGINNISPALTKAVIWSEDRKFYEHGGVDWMALGAAVVENLMGESKRGASTITMQLASMLDRKLRPQKVRRSIEQKWDQISAARELDASWKKDEILEAYLNLVTFRSELQGIEAATRGLFGKSPDGLDERESLLLASLIRAPNATIDTVAARACALADSMKSTAKCQAIKALAAETLVGPYRITFRHSLAPHTAKQLLRDGKKKAVSTLDGGLQKFTIETLTYQLRALSDRNVRDGAVLVVDNNNGEILAYVANSGMHSSARHVDGVAAMRQAGSTLKPFLYALAIENGLLTAASLLDDSAVNVPTPAGLYIPQNYDSAFNGFVSVRTALSSSLNIPAVRALMLVEPDNFGRRLRALGFRNLKDGDYYGLSMALGSVDVSLYDLVNAYRTIANRGKWSGMTIDAAQKKGKSKQVMNRASTFIVADILSDRAARSLTFGFENPLSTRFWTAVKTGTSKDMRDNWCVGFSGRYTVGVWVGNFSGAPMWNVSGVSGAAPVWLEVMNYLHRHMASRPMPQPKDVVVKRVAFSRAAEPERNEYFIKGSEPVGPVANISITNRTGGKIAISYPADKTIIAVDPDIPPENSLIFFEATAGGRFEWFLNNEKIGGGEKMISWKPQLGIYKLSLVDKEGKAIDSIKFEVRGRPRETGNQDLQRMGEVEGD